MGVEVHGFGKRGVLGCMRLGCTVYWGTLGWVALYVIVYDILGVCWVGVHRDIGVCSVRVCFGLRCTVSQGFQEAELHGFGVCCVLGSRSVDL